MILAGACVALVLRLLQRRRQLRLFTEQIREIRKEKQNRVIRVEQFDADTIELAKELQAYVEEEKLLIQKAEENRQAVKIMVAGISHDFRTPLTAVSGYVQMALQDQELSQRSRTYLEKAMAKTSYLKELSDEFFALSLVEGKENEERKRLSLKRLLEDVTLAQHEWIRAAGIAFSADVTKDACEVMANEVDVLRLLENLFSNARKYAKSRISIQLFREEEDIVLIFSNDNELITTANIKSIFQPFYRSSSGNTPGSGLGLYVVKRIVEKYDGRISAGVDDKGDFEIRIVI